MPELGYFIQPYQLPTGRLMYCLREARASALDYGFDDLIAAADRALAFATELQKLEREYAKGRGRNFRPSNNTYKIDPVLDRQIGAFRDLLASSLKTMERSDPLHDRVAAMLHHLFPRGVAAITNLPYVEQLAACEDLLRETAQFTDVIDALSLQRSIATIADTTARYRRALNSAAPPAIDFAKIRVYREKGTEHLIEVIAIVLGKFHSSSDEHRLARAKLLGPIVEQQEAMREALRINKSAGDVDPENGVVIWPEELQPE